MMNLRKKKMKKKKMKKNQLKLLKKLLLNGKVSMIIRLSGLSPNRKLQQKIIRNFINH